mmetsp:Transcript_50449/g.126674  ORF Transcript_50449/g.126674 Transcript_50449/m.126674 type:complete len:250 (-) Transcript_50449:267-1016(-)
MSCDDHADPTAHPNLQAHLGLHGEQAMRPPRCSPRPPLCRPCQHPHPGDTRPHHHRAFPLGRTPGLPAAAPLASARKSLPCGLHPPAPPPHPRAVPCCPGRWSSAGPVVCAAPLPRSSALSAASAPLREPSSAQSYLVSWAAPAPLPSQQRRRAPRPKARRSRSRLCADRLLSHRLGPLCPPLPHARHAPARLPAGLPALLFSPGPSPPPACAAKTGCHGGALRAPEGTLQITRHSSTRPCLPCGHTCA